MKEKLQQIGKQATIKLGSLYFKVVLVDYKYTYGRDRWKVTPVEGSGETWVEHIRVIEGVED